MKAIIIGAGNYGNRLAGRNYLKGKLGAELVGVVDPNIDKIKRASNYYLKDVPTYHSLDEVPLEVLRTSVADIAVHPKFVPEIYTNLINKGSRKIILPKPVAESIEEFEQIIDLSQKNNADTLVSSNWHYSKITDFVKAVLKKSTKNDEPVNITNSEFMKKLREVDSGYDIEKVRVEYNKKNEKLDIDPPFQEMPHAVQIIHSTGLGNLEKSEIFMNDGLQTNSRVNAVFYSPDTVRNGIEANSDLKKGNKLSENRERVAKIYLDKKGEKAVIIADYNAEFNEHGECTRLPGIQYFSTDGKTIKTWQQTIEEDNMSTMYNKMMNFFDGEKNNSLTVEEYHPISKCLNKINDLWHNALNHNEKKKDLYIFA